VQENILIVVAWCALLLAWRNPNQRWRWLGLAAGFCAVFAGLFVYWMPTHSAMPHYYALRYYLDPATLDGLSDVNRSLVLAQNLFSNLLSMRSLRTLISIGILPAAGMVLLRPNFALLGALPGVFFIMAARHPLVHHPANQYPVLVIPFVMTAMVPGVRWLISRFPEYRRGLVALIVAAPLALTLTQKVGPIEAAAMVKTHWHQSLRADITAIKTFLKDDDVILIDANFMPMILGFAGNPAPLNMDDLVRATHVISISNLSELTDCNVIQPGPDDMLAYDFPAFYQYCYWLKKTPWREQFYPSGLRMLTILVD
jgi:hypothetical protein